ncbi:hypothetical protein [Profundibacter sp.]
MSWPKPIKILPLHDYELKRVDLNERPSFDFALGGVPNVRLTFSGVRGLVATGMVWPQNVIFRAEVFRSHEFSQPAFDDVIQLLSKDCFVDRQTAARTRADGLVISIGASIGFEMLVIADSYSLEFPPDGETN